MISNGADRGELEYVVTGLSFPETWPYGSAQQGLKLVAVDVTVRAAGSVPGFIQGMLGDDERRLYGGSGPSVSLRDGTLGNAGPRQAPPGDAVDLTLWWQVPGRCFGVPTAALQRLQRPRAVPARRPARVGARAARIPSGALTWCEDAVSVRMGR
ncbi:MAG: hypothetical protein ACYC5O_16030 [Anaerolineae bacterium]